MRTVRRSSPAHQSHILHLEELSDIMLRLLLQQEISAIVLLQMAFSSIRSRKESRHMKRKKTRDVTKYSHMQVLFSTHGCPGIIFHSTTSPPTKYLVCLSDFYTTCGP